MPIVFICFSLLVAFETFFGWRKKGDNFFLLLFSVALFISFINTWSYLNSTLFFASATLTYLLIACASMYHWRKTGEKFLVYVFFISLFAVINRIYNSYIREIIDISGHGEKIISSFITLVYAFLLLGLIVSLFSQKIRGK